MTVRNDEIEMLKRIQKQVNNRQLQKFIDRVVEEKKRHAEYVKSKYLKGENK